MPLLVPTKPLASQTLTTTLNGQSTTINVYALGQGDAAPLYMDVLLNGSLVVGGVVCQNLNRIVRDIYRGYSGDFAWNDTQGTDDPQYGGLGSRWQLWYFYAAELT